MGGIARERGFDFDDTPDSTTDYIGIFAEICETPAQKVQDVIVDRLIEIKAQELRLISDGFRSSLRELVLGNPTR